MIFSNYANLIMRHLTVLIIIFFWLPCMAQDSTLAFRGGAYGEILTEAKRQHKPIMLYFHFDGCGACRQMEKTVFKEPSVQDFYRRNFLCHSINTLKGEGPQLLKQYGVSLQPAFLFVDSSGVVLHKIVGVFSPQAFVKAGDVALKHDGTSLVQLRNAYLKGDRSPETLFRFVYTLSDAAEPDSAVVQQYFQTQSAKDLEKPENIKMMYEFFLIRHKAVFDFNSREFQFMANNRSLFEAFFDKKQVDIRLIWAANQNIHKIAMRKDEATMRAIEHLLVDCSNPEGRYDYKEMDDRLTGVIFSDDLATDAWLAFFQKTGDTTRYAELKEASIKAAWDDWEQLNSMAWSAYLNEDKIEQLEKAITWAERSIELKEEYANMDTYAALTYKVKRFDLAKKIALRAIEIGKSKGEDVSETEALLERIETALKK